MRILWVKFGGLWPLTTGGRLRSFHIIRELTRRNHLIVATTQSAGDDPGGLRKALRRSAEVISVPCTAPTRGTPRFAISLLRSWFSRDPLDSWRYRLPALGRRVAGILQSGEVDLCVADFLAAIPSVPLGSSVPIVLFAHNVEHIIWKRLKETEERAWLRPLLELEWRKVRRWEARSCGRVALTIAVSDVDRALLREKAPGVPVHAIPTGVDTGYFVPNGTVEVPTELVFTGSMDWYPNEDAILYCIDAVFPLIRARVPGVSLSVAGRNPSRRLLAAAAKAGVRVTGTVNDIRPHIAQAGIYVVPLRIGGGTRLKIFEALAMGKAVVSTTVGAEGLPLIPGTHFVAADDPGQFARAVVSLIRDPAKRKALGVAGRRLVEERYSWRQVAREFEIKCQEVLSDNAH